MEKVNKPKGMVLDMAGHIGMFISRLTIGYLWYTQLLWKMPPLFGCPPNFAVTTDIHARTTSLCDWVGVMTIYSKWPLQASLVESYVVPNMAWMGWLIWLLEAFVALSLILGLFTRLGGFAGLIQAINLYIGLTAAPFEWYWTYGMLIVLSLIFMTVPTGRTLGVDGWLRPRLQAGADKGNRLAKLLLSFT